MSQSEGCVSCGRELHEECSKNPCCCTFTTETKTIIDAVSQGLPGRPRKADDDISISAGRKRAAEAYPLYTEKPCEWRWQANCGGGKFPVMGCLDGKQVNRHHGPVKNTARNEQSNIHLICSPCHNLWHARNDEHYDEETYATLPHNPRPMTPEEMAQAR